MSGITGITGTTGTSSAPQAPQVLIVGAGPVGLSAAHELARHGVRVRLVDAAQGPATTSRALANHARTLETYDQMGVLDELLARGQRVEHFTLHQNGRRLIRFDTDYSRLPTRFPFTLMVDQVITEEVLRAAASRYGVDVEWGVRLTEFEDTGAGVTARLAHADGRVETVAADWLVGCDGGHSTVRKQLGIDLVGDSSETWLIADAVVHCDLPRDSIHWMRTPRGTVMMVPFPDPGKWRLLDTAETSYGGDDAMVARRFAEKIGTGIGRPVRVEEPSWVSVFTIQQRMIPRMRAGRCFLAGDAAHVHSPASGQGMNTGVQDAVNLAWKLAAVVRGEAAESVLDSYGPERVPVGAELLRSTGMATALVQLRSRTAAAALRTVFTVLRTLRPVKSRIQRKIMGGMSALGLHYTDGLLAAAEASGAPADGPVPGTRVVRVTAAGLAASEGWRHFLDELRRPGWTLLAADADTAGLDALREIARGYPVRVRTLDGTRDTGGDGPVDGPLPLPDPGGLLRAALGLTHGGWVLVRPDGYTAATGPSVSARPPGPVLDGLGVLAAVGVSAL
ncbi:FAD-dependent oxidoreductase [Streptomyces sp. BG9H]|uniref:FAD-dependent oxidoreductase n=1 Tax=Streptomyces anatolicus TaxID=2675858 RepID=A0ABS6YUQ1_9ACTN|nr:FAD-dependent oxidoreductase [Streptomyces anatolicus]MBW5425162.1 FAD-dependent oxidoreductase [Streptomyces anatolicus]